MKKLDLAGQRYGRLLVLSDAGKTKNGGTKWLCKCDCGKELEVFIGHLRNGNTKSCGCYSHELLAKNATVHGESKNGTTTPEYEAWRGAKDRCYNPNYEGFHNYGGRGINVCDRWLESFDNFLADMGRRPSLKHSLDRFPDMNGDYGPNNCRWATPSEQQNNRRTNIFYEYNGEKLTQTQWSERIGMKYKNFHALIKRHSFEKVMADFEKYGDVDRREHPEIFYSRKRRTIHELD